MIKNLFNYWLKRKGSTQGLESIHDFYVFLSGLKYPYLDQENVDFDIHLIDKLEQFIRDKFDNESTLNWGHILKNNLPKGYSDNEWFILNLKEFLTKNDLIEE